MKERVIILILLAFILGCVEIEEKEVEELVEKIDVRLEFSEFPKKYTCDGEDVSPRIEVSGIKDAKSIAIIVDDPDAPIGTFTHWLIWNIEPTNVIPEGVPKKGELADPIKAVQGKNDFGRIGYNGPCPPPGKPHRYFFKVYALNAKLDLPPGSSKSSLEKEIEKHVVQYGEAIATYGR